MGHSARQAGWENGRYTMTAFLDGYCLNTEKVKETKGVCFDNLAFSAGPELSSLFPWVLGVEEGGVKEQEGPGGLCARRRVYGPLQCLGGLVSYTGPETECHLGCQSGLILLCSLWRRMRNHQILALRAPMVPDNISISSYCLLWAQAGLHH